MDFVDRTLLRLADATERSAVLTPAVGNRILGAAFVFANVEVGDVTGVSVRDVELAPTAIGLQRVEAAFHHMISGERWEASGSLVEPRPTTTAHALLELGLTTETRLADSSVERVEVDSLRALADVAAVDARIVADDGALPNDPVALGTRRFDALKTLLLESFDQPADVDVDLLVAGRGIADFDGLLASLAEPHHPARVQVEIVVDGTLPSRVETHRVIAAALVEPAVPFPLLNVVERVQAGRAVMERTTETATAPHGMRSRVALPFVVIVPQAVLDDDDLPVPAGTNPQTAPARRAARLTELQTRLTPFGVALAPIAT